MSLSAVLWAFEAKVESTSQFAVLVVLADYADAAGRAWPSNETICRRTKLSERTVRSTIAELIDLELIKITRRQRATNVATLAVPNLSAEAVANAPKVEGVPVEAPPKAATGAKNEGATFADQEFPDRQMSPLRGQISPPEGATVAPDPVIEPIKEPRTPPKSPIEPKAASSGLATVRQGKALREEAAAAIDREGDQRHIALPGPRPSKAVAVHGDFEAFWAAYPRKVGKGAARAAYAKALRKAKADEVAAGLSRWMHGRAFPSDPKFIPHPTTWLNQERWEDWRDGDGSTYLPLERATMAGEALMRRISEDEGEHELFEDSVAERRLRLAAREEPRRMAVAAPKPAVAVAQPVTEADIARCAAVWNGMAERHGMSMVEPHDISQTAREALPRILTRFGVAGWQKAVEAIDSSENLRQRLPLSFDWLAEEPERFARFAR